jgi:hypothetical protein
MVWLYFSLLLIELAGGCALALWVDRRSFAGHRLVAIVLVVAVSLGFIWTFRQASNALSGPETLRRGPNSWWSI